MPHRVTDFCPALLLQEIALTHQKLRNLQPYSLEELRIDAHDAALADPSDSALQRGSSGLLLQSQLAATHAYGSRRDKDDFEPFVGEIGDDFHQPRKIRDIHPLPSLVGGHDRRSSDLQHKSLSFSGHHVKSHGGRS